VEAAANPPSRSAPIHGPCCSPNQKVRPSSPLQQADLHVRDPDFEAFWHDFRILVELLTELPEGDPHAARLRAGLEQACQPARAPRYLRHLASGAACARGAADPTGGTADPCREASVGHAHLDTAWLWPLRETIRKCARTFSTVLELMDRYPEVPVVVSPGPAPGVDAGSLSRALGADEDRIAEGRLEPTGSMWVESDCNIPSGDVARPSDRPRQALLPERVRIETNDVWLPDVFGYSAALRRSCSAADPVVPQPRSSPGISTTFFPTTLSCGKGSTDRGSSPISPPADTYSGNVSVRELPVRGSRIFKRPRSATRSLYLFGWGDGGGGPTSEMLESARRLADIDGLPRLTMEGPRQFFTEAEAECTTPAVWVGELYLEFHRGTYTSQAATKLGNRRAEFDLRDVGALEFVSARVTTRTVSSRGSGSVCFFTNSTTSSRIGHSLGL